MIPFERESIKKNKQESEHKTFTLSLSSSTSRTRPTWYYPRSTVLATHSCQSQAFVLCIYKYSENSQVLQLSFSECSQVCLSWNIQRSLTISPPNIISFPSYPSHPVRVLDPWDSSLISFIFPIGTRPQSQCFGANRTGLAALAEYDFLDEGREPQGIPLRNKDWNDDYRYKLIQA